MSEDINVTDGTILEALNSKIDIDGGNYGGSGLEAIIGYGLPVGSIFQAMREDVPRACLRVDGTEYTTGFDNFVTNYLATGKIICKSFEEWQTEYTMTGGNVGFFGYNEATGAFKTPCIQAGTFLAQAVASGEFGSFLNSELKSHNHFWGGTTTLAGGHDHDRGSMNITGWFENNGHDALGGNCGGAFTNDHTAARSNNGDASDGGIYYFNAASTWTGRTSWNGDHTHDISGFTSLTGGDDTYPKHIRYPFFVVVSNVAAEEPSQADWDNFVGNLDGKANKSLNNLDEQGEKHFLNKQQITNCLLEVPQRIKLELNNGVLTLKAGSEVIVPNGFEADGITPKFDYVTVESDVSFGNWEVYTNANSFILYNPTHKTITPWEKTLSGPTPPAADTHGIWYDTAYNLVNWTEGGNSNWNAGMSLPIALVEFVNGVPVSIKQVFNGMGCIGSSWWLENVEGLAANGYNTDGSYQNIQHKLNSIQILTYTTETAYDLIGAFNINGGIGAAQFKEVAGTPSYFVSTWILNTIDNKTYYWDAGGNRYVPQAPITPCCRFDLVNGQIYNFKAFNAFRAVSHSEKATVAGWAMPSNRYIDLTLGASDTTYTAPANGWVFLQDTGNQPYSALVLRNYQMRVSLTVGASGNPIMSLIMPVKKNDIFIAEYAEITGENRLFRFIYAEGEV